MYIYNSIIYNIIDNNINKCLKSYLCGKKYLNIDKEKSYTYFSQSLKIIDKLKLNNINIPSHYKEIINETEIECYNYLPINLFNVIETGDINILNKLNKINFKVYNDIGLTPLHHAINYGDISFLKFALKSGCNIDETTLSGHTLLEYACLEKDPNIISFLIDNGANMKKHIEFRKNNKYINNGNSIDIILLLKLILDIDNDNLNKSENHLDWIFKFINPNIILDIKYNNNNNNNNNNNIIIFNDLIIKFNYFLDNLQKEFRETYLNIIKDELEYDLINNSDCPNNKIELILYYLIPFINFEFNLNLLFLNNKFYK